MKNTQPDNYTLYTIQNVEEGSGKKAQNLKPSPIHQVMKIN